MSFSKILLKKFWIIWWCQFFINQVQPILTRILWNFKTICITMYIKSLALHLKPPLVKKFWIIWWCQFFINQIQPILTRILWNFKAICIMNYYKCAIGQVNTDSLQCTFQKYHFLHKGRHFLEFLYRFFIVVKKNTLVFEIAVLRK